MRRWNAELERREAVRKPTRLPCVVWAGSNRYEGVLERMEAVPPGSHEAKLTFSAPNGLSFALRATPLRGHVVPHTLRGLLAPSVVLHVREPADSYLRWVNAPALDVS